MREQRFLAYNLTPRHLTHAALSLSARLPAGREPSRNKLNFFGHFQTNLPTPQPNPNFYKTYVPTSTFSTKIQSRLNTFSGTFGK